MTESVRIDDRSVDISNCAQEPIHIPAAIQPHGVLLSVDERTMEIQQISESCARLLGISAQELLGTDFTNLLATSDADVLRLALSADLETVNPLALTMKTPTLDASFDAVLHRSPTSLIIELEPLPRGGLSFNTSYKAIRSAGNELNKAATLEELAQITAREIRNLTSFDRVMMYRFDENANGEVIAEAKRDDLEPFLGLHFPESDIPAQARALYLRNWLRIIPDARYQPSALVPERDPVSDQPLDLSGSVLRSVSPIHCQYLANMGVRASMSISLVHKGKLWGLIACHHYDGPLYVPYVNRSAAEFLGQTASVLLGAKEETTAYDEALVVRSVQARLLDQLEHRREDVVSAITKGQTNILELVNASGAALAVDGEISTLGEVPNDDQLRRVAEWLWPVTGGGADFFSTVSLGTDNAAFADLAPVASGLIASAHPSRRDNWVMWFRPEKPVTVNWAGNPHEKIIDTAMPDQLHPRTSFALWSETVSGKAAAWTRHEVLASRELSHRIFAQLTNKLQAMVDEALSFRAQLSFQNMPSFRGLKVAGEYRPGDGGLLGGDWYDAMPLPDSSIALVIGDVAGHGAVAASAMSEIRSGMRAYLVEDSDPATALRHLNELVSFLLPNNLATGMVAIFDPVTGDLRLSNAGHLPPVLIRNGETSLLQLPRSPALGVSDQSHYEVTTTNLAPGDTLLMYTDGLVESRTESLYAGIDRLVACAADADIDDLDKLCSCVTDQMATSPHQQDDVAILAVQRTLPD